MESSWTPSSAAVYNFGRKWLLCSLFYNLVTGEELPTVELDEVAPFLLISQNRKTKVWRKAVILSGQTEVG